MILGKISNLRWYIVTLLFFATLVNYVDRQTLSIAMPVIKDEYGLSNTDYAGIVFAFLLAYTVMQLVSGRLMDLLGTRKCSAPLSNCLIAADAPPGVRLAPSHTPGTRLWWTASGALDAASASQPARRTRPALSRSPRRASFILR